MVDGTNDVRGAMVDGFSGVRYTMVAEPNDFRSSTHSLGSTIGQVGDKYVFCCFGRGKYREPLCREEGRKAENVIFKGTYSFMWCSRRKMKATSVQAERLRKPLIRMKLPYLFNCIRHLQRNLQLHVVL